MINPAFIGRPDGRAVMLIWDIGPEVLWNLVRRDGLERCRHVLIGPGLSWLHLDPRQSGEPDVTVEELCCFVNWPGYGQMVTPGHPPVHDWAKQVTPSRGRAVYSLEASQLVVHGPSETPCAIAYDAAEPDWSAYPRVEQFAAADPIRWIPMTSKRRDR